jgi:hypothetical protein
VAREERKLLELLKTLERERERERMLPGLIVGCLGQLQRSEAVGLVVIDEEDNQTLLVHRISADDIYRRQEGGCILLWAGRKSGFCFLSDVVEAKENYPSRFLIIYKSLLAFLFVQCQTLERCCYMQSRNFTNWIL